MGFKIKDFIKTFDFRDLLFVSGFAGMSYGFYEFLPWVAFVISGFFMMAISVLMRGK
jgi:hypothetical protein